uniref:Inhibitor of Bruton tyrosine kinase n=1 Tax=Salmo trutta TaxID=8032 RepID=A0A674E195_SALTR
MSVVMATPDCTPKCRSMRHADEVVAALTRGSEGRLRAFLNAHCHNAATLRDAFGRTALHLAASLGKRALLEWLLESKSADLMVKDKESGWTALHRSIFYGHIHCLMSLIKHGGILSTQDKEGLSVLDLSMKDRPAHVVFTKTDPTEVYTWGNNTNFSLGHGNQESRHHPEIVDLFARTRVYVKQVVLCKFHSVFLSQKGQVYTCGHGQGGRLGHGDEQTYLVPRMVEGLLSHHCSQVAAAKDHTVVLTEEGYVYTFGLNTFHQLGLAPPPASSHLPKQVFSKTLKGRTVIGVAAGRFHTVLWTREAVYTVGLNGGQLGYLLDPNGERCVTAPRQVSALYHKDVTIAMAVASNGATLVVTEKGDVYLLADYQCKKLASRQLNIRKVLVSGGSLDHRVDPQVLNEGGGEKVAILALDEAGRVFCWRSVGGSVRQCRWAYGRQVFMSDIALSRNNMMFVTQEGEGFSGQWHGEYRKSTEKKGDISPLCALDGSVEVCGYPEGGTVYERIRLEKLPYVHRAVSITMDSKGRNFGVLQSDPKTSLDGVKYENGTINVVHKMTADKPRYNQKKCSYLCDVTLRSEDGKEFPCHKCVLCARLEYFHSMLGNPWIEATSCSALEMPTSSEILQVILEYVYTDESPTIKESLNVEFVCNVLVVADQLLITRLKEMCEVPSLLSSHNAAELLQFSAMYNAEQLKLSCIQFIVHNMAIPAMQKRLITPYPDAPDLTVYEDVDSSFSSKADAELDFTCRETLLKKAKLKAKKKPRRRSDSSGGYTLSDIIQILSPSLVKSGKINSMESLQELMTSDSEGSYKVLGSPRELQSPVFHDRPEEGRAEGGPRLKTPPSTPTAATMRNGLPAEPPKSSVPEHIPKVTASPALSLPVLDLRAIMDMEASSKTQSLRATPKSPVSVGSSSKQSPLPAKLSQKQRKMIAMATKEGSAECALSKSPPVITPSKNDKTPPPSRAFRDLLVEEESRVRNGRPGSLGRPVAQGPLVSAGEKRNNCFEGENVQPVTNSMSFSLLTSPWVLGVAGSPPTASMVTFASIVEEEKQQEAALIRSREKPLALIQIEEAAIQELLYHYGTRNNPDEMIVVERSVQGPIAIPFWNKH